ncbi:FKBP-type peptidyl-prolyl cis-trans isomerase [Candidatus Woesearchaeota archaeon]|nr:FKBP-type peptidyl-prolyl cis-trans isomerase [Candidatus Woesearchaeota archaeon]
MVKKPNEETKNKTDSKKSVPNRYFILGVIGLIIVLVIIFFSIEMLSKNSVKTGDIVQVDYVGYLEDGKIFDTSIKEIGEKGLLNKEAYSPLEFQVGKGNMIPGFEKAIVGLQNGEKTKVEILPEEAYGAYREDLVLRDNKRELELKKDMNVTKETYKNLFEKDPVLNDVIEMESVPWKLKVKRILNNEVFIENLLSKNEKITIPGTTWESYVKDIKNGVILIRQNPQIENSVAFPTSSGFVRGEVNNVKEDTYDIDTNHPLAGKKLIFEITLLNIKREN